MPVVDNPRDAIENIRRYQTEVQEDKPAAQKLIGRMKQASVWYAVRSVTENRGSSGRRNSSDMRIIPPRLT